jgi:preprotein translocase subunit SecY
MGSDLARRVLVTLGALFIYQLGTYIPLPGIDPDLWMTLVRDQPRLLGPFQLPSVAVRLAILSLAIVPYLSAAIALQLLSIVSGRLRALQAQGARGRRILIRLTLGLTVLFAAFQAYGIATSISEAGGGLIAVPGWLFVVSTVLTMTAGAIVVVFLSEIITGHGVGNGIALILLVGFVAQLPGAAAYTLGARSMGILSDDRMIGLIAIAIVVIAVIAFVEHARRRIVIDYPARVLGQRTIEGRSSDLSLKLNPAGLIPALVAPWLLGVASGGARLAAAIDPDRWGGVAEKLKGGTAPHFVLLAVLIVLCTFLYSAFVLDPDAAAENLQKHGGTIAGIEPGEATAAYLDQIGSRVTAIGAAYLTVVFLIPEWAARYLDAPFNIGGTPYLVAVCAVLDIAAQVRSARRPS